MSLGFLDYFVISVYLLLIVVIGLVVSRNKSNAQDYFLAGKTLPWWAIGSSLIAANISAEQFIGMSGSGFAIGLAIASYEWMAGITLLLVGKFLLPVFISKEIYTIPEFIEKRFSTNLKTILAFFWISLFIFINLTTVMYLGAKAIDTIIGTGDGSILVMSIVGLALFSALYSIWGGLASVAWSDIVQVVVLIIGGFVLLILSLIHISNGEGILAGLVHVYEKLPEKFSMILSKGEIITPDGRDAWGDLPGISVLIGGMWVANVYYWGFNQYIIQRTLASKSLDEAQKGIVLAAAIKMIIPLIVVVPGIIAYSLNSDSAGLLTNSSLDPSFLRLDGSIDSDNAVPWLIRNFIPVGFKGLVVAALIAAIVSSLASMLNSTATIFTMDIFVPFSKKKLSDANIVLVGRFSAIIALVISSTIAPYLNSLPQAFQFIQEYTGIVSPGILAVFLLGIFWKQTTNNAAIIGVLSSIPIAFFFKISPKNWSSSEIFPNLPFLDQMFWTWALTVMIILLISYFESKGKNNDKAIILDKSLFHTSTSFNVGASIVIILCAFLYAFFW